MRWLHLYSQLLAITAFLLITIGGLVTSTGSGLAVPDWPNTYGYFMFSFPVSKMVGGIFYEHGHRLIASTVGLLTIGLAVWLSNIEQRFWLRRLGWIAVGVVITQGVLGGITVLYLLPAPISIGHAGLAQIFFALIVSLAIFTSPGWKTQYRRESFAMNAISNDMILRRLSVFTVITIYIQILIGATMRHTGAGLAIPDFPLAFGEIIPPIWSTAITIHFAHRMGGIIVTCLVLAIMSLALAHHRKNLELTRPAQLMLIVVLVQFMLGAWTVLSERQVSINTAHVATGSLLFVISVVFVLRMYRDRFVELKDNPKTSKQTKLFKRSQILKSYNSPGAD